MPNKESQKILEEMLEGMTSGDELQNADEEGSKLTSEPASIIDEPRVSDNKQANAKSQKRAQDNKNAPTYKDLKIKKGVQNLEERSSLIKKLSILFGLQLLFMNIIVLVTILWIAFDFSWLNEVKLEFVEAVIGLLKYYITAVLVELLGGIIFIVHQVFSDTTIEKLGK